MSYTGLKTESNTRNSTEERERIQCRGSFFYTNGKACNKKPPHYLIFQNKTRLECKEKRFLFCASDWIKRKVKWRLSCSLGKERIQEASYSHSSLFHSSIHPMLLLLLLRPLSLLTTPSFSSSFVLFLCHFIPFSSGFRVGEFCGVGLLEVEIFHPRS